MRSWATERGEQASREAATMVDQIQTLAEENRRLREALERLAKRGIHADCMPTLAAGTQDIGLVMFFYDYLRRADATVREIAKAGLGD